jgi:transcriptional regulator with XRE-family HTH domain
MAKLISFKSYFNEKMKDPEFAKEFHNAEGEIRFAVSLAMLREKRGLTQSKLGEMVGAKQPMIARYEKGQIPSVTMLKKLTHVLNGVFTIDPDGVVVVIPAESHRTAA